MKEFFRITIVEGSAILEVGLLKIHLKSIKTLLVNLGHTCYNENNLSDKSSLTESQHRHRWTFVEAFWFLITLLMSDSFFKIQFFGNFCVFMKIWPLSELDPGGD